MDKLTTLLYSKCYLLILLVGYSCLSDDRSINIYSYEIESQKEKLQQLKTYLTKDSGLLDAEYHIVFHDNSTGFVPGPSDHHITLALKIESDSLDAWINNNLDSTSQSISLEFWTDLNLEPNKWELNSKPEVFISKNKKLLKMVYRNEAIILGIYSSTSLIFL